MSHIFWPFALSVLLRFAASGYTFDILKHFLVCMFDTRKVWEHHMTW